MTVEIRELIIKTHITEPESRFVPAGQAEELRLLKSQIIQECLKALRGAGAFSRFER